MRTTLRKPNPPAWERLAAAKDTIAVATGGHRPGGLRIDWKRLDEDEQRELIGLCDAAREGGGINLSRLEGRRKRFESLVEKGVDAKPGTIFDSDRAFAELRQMGADMKRERQAGPRRARLEEAGSITLKKQWVFDFVRDSVLWPAHIAALVYVASVFENGDLPVPSPSASYDGDAIRVDLRRGHLLPDPNGNFLDEEKLLDHLALNKFIELEKNGKTWTIRPGSRLRALRAAA